MPSMEFHGSHVRAIASLRIFQILFVSIFLTITFIRVHSAYFKSPREKTLLRELTSENSELGQHLKTLVHNVTVKKNLNITSVTTKFKVPKQIHASLLRHADLPQMNKYWSEILHFVPKKNNKNCLNLFTTESSKDIAVTPEWEKTRQATTLSKYPFRYVPQHDKLTLTYQELARQKFVQTVCEIGFNVGQSAISWLTSKPGIRYYGFDNGVRGPTPQMGKELEKLFPGHFNLTIGDSTKTVPVWNEEGVKCDIISVDGGHEYPTVIQDLHNMQKAAAKEHIIVIDDIYYPGVNKAWMEMVHKGAVHHLFDCWIPGMDLDVAIGYYKANNY